MYHHIWLVFVGGVSPWWGWGAPRCVARVHAVKIINCYYRYHNHIEFDDCDFAGQYNDDIMAIFAMQDNESCDYSHYVVRKHFWNLKPQDNTKWPKNDGDGGKLTNVLEQSTWTVFRKVSLKEMLLFLET